MFAVVFGLSMDYEVFRISRVHEEWVRRRDASTAVGDGMAEAEHEILRPDWRLLAHPATSGSTSPCSAHLRGRPATRSACRRWARLRRQLARGSLLSPGSDRRDQRARGVDWISLRPPRLVNRPSRYTSRIDTRPLAKARAITYGDLATALVDSLTGQDLFRHAVYVAN